MRKQRDQRQSMDKILFFVLLVLSAIADAKSNELDFIRFTFENDALFSEHGDYSGDEDGGYSSGVILSWGYNEVNALSPQTLPSWIAYLADKTYLTADPTKRYGISYSFGQFLQTALDISIAELVEQDAPYVGLLAWEGQLSAYNNTMSDEICLLLGIVGPAAGGHLMQASSHKLLSARGPQGWGNQIENEAVFRLQGKRSWRVFSASKGAAEFDLITAIGGGVGNLRSDLGGGLAGRWGRNLQSNFFSASAFPVEKLNSLNSSTNGWYIFVNTSVAYVANDIFMDGNTWQESHSVELKNEQLAVSAGVMGNIASWSIAYAFSILSDQYQGQARKSRFGSISITYNFN